MGLETSRLHPGWKAPVALVQSLLKVGHQVAQGCVQLRLEYLKELHDLSPLPVLDLPHDKKPQGFLYHPLRISHVSCCLSLWSSENSLSLSSLCPPIWDLQTAARPPLCLFLSRLDKCKSLHISPYIVCCGPQTSWPIRIHQVPSCKAGLRSVTPTLHWHVGLSQPRGRTPHLPSRGPCPFSSLPQSF